MQKTGEKKKGTKTPPINSQQLVGHTGNNIVKKLKNTTEATPRRDRPREKNRKDGRFSGLDVPIGRLSWRGVDRAKNGGDRRERIDDSPARKTGEE